MQVGDTSTWERTFSEEEVRLFAQLSGDRGEHHVRADDQGRLMVHGLLTATLPTKLGGDMNYIARTMDVEFLRPVYVGDTVHCAATVTQLNVVEARIQVSIRFTCHNQRGKEVLRGHTAGIIRMPSPDKEK